MERDYGYRNCVWCGKLFHANSARHWSCGDDHYRPCAVCGKPVLIKESYNNYIKHGPRSCWDCRSKLISDTYNSKSEVEKQSILDKRKSTFVERYGVDNPLKVDSIKSKVKATVRNRYGVDNLSQSPEIQERIRRNSRDKYGVDHYSNAPEIRKRMIDGMLAKYGVSSALKSDILRNKMKSTCLSKYGVDNVMRSDAIKAKLMQTCLDRYGVKYAAQAESVVSHRIETNYTKYGAKAYIYSDDYLKTIIKDPSKYGEYCKFKENPESYINDNFSIPTTYHIIADRLGIGYWTVGEYVIKYNLQHLIHYNSSNLENLIIDYLRTLDGDINIIRHNRKLASPYEIDIYLPDYKIGIECNPTVTHNSSIGDPWTNEPKDYKYHQMKSILAEQNGIFLFHIFGYEWTHRKDVIKSMLASLLGKSCNKIYARKCYVSEIDFNMCRDFLDQNHRQGSMSAKVRLGLFVDDTNELVSVMTFNHIRKTLGKKFDDDAWELSRFCSKLNTSVVGGASKLLRYFIDNYDYDRIISYSDVAHTRGNLYSILGFTPNRISSTRYVWVNLSDDTYFNRVSCQKSNMHRLFPNESIDLSKTERQIMEEHGYVRVYDSGTIRWEYKKKSG